MRSACSADLLFRSGNYVYLEDEIGVGGTGGVHVLDTHGCDGVHTCAPTQVGYWHINGHPVQAAAVTARAPAPTEG